MSVLQEQFVTEARDLIRQATDDLIVLERGESSERIDSVFRAFHTLKGSAGVVELPAMSIVLHAAEDLLAGIRHGTLGVNAEIIDTALACLDQVSRWVDDFEDAGALPSQAGEEARAMAERLRSFLPGSVAKNGSCSYQFHGGRERRLIAGMGFPLNGNGACRFGAENAGAVVPE